MIQHSSFCLRYAREALGRFAGGADSLPVTFVVDLESVQNWFVLGVAGFIGFSPTRQTASGTHANGCQWTHDGSGRSIVVWCPTI